jgi:hypothetical protein
MNCPPFVFGGALSATVAHFDVGLRRLVYVQVLRDPSVGRVLLDLPIACGTQNTDE